MLLVAWALGGVSVRAEVFNRIVGVVNDDVITLHELNRKIQELMGLDPVSLREQDPERYRAVGRAVLEGLINERIAREKIRELGIVVRPEEVDAAIERIMRTNGISRHELEGSLQKQRLSMEAYREQIRSQLERSRLISLEVKAKIVIREERIRTYYENHLAEFSKPERVHLAAIFLKAEDAEDGREIHNLEDKARRLLALLRQGADFADLARRYSQGPGADRGGDVGFFVLSQLDPKLAQTVQAMAPGDVGGPIRMPAGVQVIRLLERQAGEAKPLDEVREHIYDTLYRQEVDRRYAGWVKQLRENAYTKITF